MNELINLVKRNIIMKAIWTKNETIIKDKNDILEIFSPHAVLSFSSIINNKSVNNHRSFRLHSVLIYSNINQTYLVSTIVINTNYQPAQALILILK